MSAQSPECTAKHPQTNAKRANTHTYTHTRSQTDALLSVDDSIVFQMRYFFSFSYTLLNHTPGSRLSLRKHITSRLQRAADSVRGDLFLHICLSVSLCRARRPYFVNIKQTDAAYFNNMFIRPHIICWSSGDSPACAPSAAQHDMNRSGNTWQNRSTFERMFQIVRVLVCYCYMKTYENWFVSTVSCNFNFTVDSYSDSI